MLSEHIRPCCEVVFCVLQDPSQSPGVAPVTKTIGNFLLGYLVRGICFGLIKVDIKWKIRKPHCADQMLIGVPVQEKKINKHNSFWGLKAIKKMKT